MVSPQHVLQQIHDTHPSNTHCYPLGYVNTLYSLARSVDARRVLEVGVGPRGLSGRAFVLAMGTGGQLTSVEINPNHPEPDVLPHKFAAQYGCSWRIMYGDSKALGMTFARAWYDIVFIDGDHARAAAEADWEKYSPYARPGGLIIVDDYGPAYPEVREVIDNLKLDGHEFTFVDYVSPNGLVWTKAK